MPAFDPLTYRYASRRNVVYAKNAVACTSVPLGAQIGLDVMKSGGSAVDAAVAMAAAMPLLEPTGNGLGSNCFALVWIERDKRLLRPQRQRCRADGAERREGPRDGLYRDAEGRMAADDGARRTRRLGGAEPPLRHEVARRAVRASHFLCRGGLSCASERRAAVGARQPPHCRRWRRTPYRMNTGGRAL